LKIIYADHSKYTLDDEILSKVDDAVREVERLMNNNWNPSIEIPVPYTRCLSDWDGRTNSKPTGQIILKVEPDVDYKPGFVQHQMRRLQGKEYSGKVTVDMGEYGHEGWMSIVSDVRELPVPYFDDTYSFNILEGNPCPDVREVDAGHWYELVSLLLEDIKEQEPSIDDIIGELSPFYERYKWIKSACHKYLENSDLDYLVRTIMIQS